jgi:DNA polymerase-3 subunit beta
MEGMFTVAQKELSSLLSAMQPICTKRTTLDITEYILVHVAPRELILKATDLEISLQSTMVLESELTESFDFLISGRRIYELVKEMEGEIICSLRNNQLFLNSGGIEAALNIKSTDEFPPFPERIENLMSCEGNFLLAMINKVAFVIPHNNASAALNGMLIECNNSQISMVATDGHSLACVTSSKYALAQESKWLIPKRAVVELKKLLEEHEGNDIFLGTCGNQLVFSGKNFNFFTKLISEQFPHYKPVLAKEGFLPARLVKDPLLKTLKRANCLLAGQFVSTQFRFTPGILKVSLNNKEVGKLDETLTLNEFIGDEIDSRFYSPYLLNGLQVFSDDSVQCFIKNAARPIIFESQDKDYNLTFLVMPVSMTQSEN